MNNNGVYPIQSTRSRVLALAAVAILVASFGLTRLAEAAGGQVTRGTFQTFAAGLGRGYDISGLAVMVRTGSDMTLVSVKAAGLASNVSYPVHVHNQPCAVGSGGGHYQHVVGGDVDSINEIWPGFTTNVAGIGSGQARNDFRARPEAQSIVIHDTDGARIACADLHS